MNPYRVICVLVVLAIGVAGAAAKDKPASSITVTVNGLGCSTSAGTNQFSAQSWSWGASNVGDPAGAGKAVISALNVRKLLDGCSPALFGAVVNGKIFNSMSLVQQDGDGNIQLTVTLNDVLVSSWQIGGSVDSVVPTENVSFNFLKMCINEPSTGSKFCYDQSTGKSF